MSSSNDDILFVEHALKRGLVSEEQVDEVLRIQEKVAEMGVPDAIPSLMVKRGLLQQKDADDILAVVRPKSRKEQIIGYHIIRRLGHGGMGSVYLARQTAMDRLVALKVLRPSLTKNPQQIERLRREALYVGKLNHPNIIRGLDVGESGGFHFLVMEYVEGETLKDRLKPGQYMKESEALRIVRDVAEGLDHAWRSRITHRDIKPDNILLRTDGVALISDYGLAKGPLDVSLTQTGSTLGTPQYLSPEQARNPRDVDIRTDIYALGATLYHMLTGRPPFSGENLAEIVTQVLLKASDPPQAINAKISGNAAFLIDRMMTKDAQHRYATPRELLRDLDAIEKGKSIVPAGWEGDWKAFVLKRRYRRLLAFSCAVFVLFVAMGITMYVGWSRAEAAQHLENASNARIEAELQEGKGGNVTFGNVETWLDSLAELDGRYGDVEPWFGDRHAVWSEAVEAKKSVVTAQHRNAALPSDHFAAKIANLLSCMDVVEGRPVVEDHVRNRIDQLKAETGRTAKARHDAIRKDARLSLEDFQRRLESLRVQFSSRWKDLVPATTEQVLGSDLGMAGVLRERLNAVQDMCREELRALAAPDSEGLFKEAWRRVDEATRNVRSQESVKEALRGLPEHIRDGFTARIAEIPDLVKDRDREACSELVRQMAAKIAASNDPETFAACVALLTSRGQNALESSRTLLGERAGDLKIVADERSRFARERYREMVVPQFRVMLRLRQPENAALLLERFRKETTPDGHHLSPWVAEALGEAVGDLEVVQEVWDRFRRWLATQCGKTRNDLKKKDGHSPTMTVTGIQGWTLSFTNEKGKADELSLRDLDLVSVLFHAGLSGSGLAPDPEDTRLAGIVRWIEESQNEENLLAEIERLNEILALLPVDIAARHRAEVNDRLGKTIERQEQRENLARSLFTDARNLLEKEGKAAAAQTCFEQFHILSTYRHTKFYRDNKDQIVLYIEKCRSRQAGEGLSKSPRFHGAKVHVFDNVDRIMKNLARVSVTWPLDEADERTDLGIDDKRVRIATSPGVAPAELPGPHVPGLAAPPDAATERRVLVMLQGDAEEDLLENHPIVIDSPFIHGAPMSIEFDVRSPRPVFLAVSLAGCTCAILSQVDRVEGGQGVSFWLKNFTRLDRRRSELQVLRRPKVSAAQARTSSPLEWLKKLERKYFHMLPDRWYHLRFTKGKGAATLRIDGRVVGEWTFRTGSPPDPRRIVILTYTTTLLDNLRIEGTLDRKWLERRDR